MVIQVLWRKFVEKKESYMNRVKLVKGDFLLEIKSAPDECVDLIVTDPPYKIITGGDSDGTNSTRPKGILSGNRELMKVIPKMSEWIPECFRILKNGSHAYFMVNSSNLLEMANVITSSGFKIHNYLIWEKNNCTPSQFYMKNCEYVIFCRKGRAKYINNIGSSKTVHKIDNILGNKVHPTEKPIPLMDIYILNSSSEGDIVFDPFMGSGTTGYSAITHNRRFIGMEIDADYFEIAKNRIESIINV